VGAGGSRARVPRVVAAAGAEPAAGPRGAAAGGRGHRVRGRDLRPARRRRARCRLVALTALAAAAAPRLRARGLGATAESVAAVALALTLLDAWGVRRLGPGSGLDDAVYAATAATAVAALTAAYAAATALRVPRLAGVALAHLAAVLGVVALSRRHRRLAAAQPAHRGRPRGAGRARAARPHHPRCATCSPPPGRAPPSAGWRALLRGGGGGPRADGAAAGRGGPGRRRRRGDGPGRGSGRVAGRAGRGAAGTPPPSCRPPCWVPPTPGCRRSGRAWRSRCWWARPSRGRCPAAPAAAGAVVGAVLVLVAALLAVTGEALRHCSARRLARRGLERPPSAGRLASWWGRAWCGRARQQSPSRPAWSPSARRWPVGWSAGPARRSTPRAGSA
jgi:hypothetical protein